MVRESNANAKKLTPGAKRTVRLRIKRCDGPGKASYWQSFDVPVTAGEGANIISALQYIAAHPTTVDGERVQPVVWDSGCLEEVCGSCTMLINGHVRQSCSALLDNYAPVDGDVVTLEPMSKFPVNRDLFVDRERMFATLRRLEAWVPIDGLYDLGKGPTEDPEKQQERYVLSTCMTCGCCLEACPQYEKETDPEKWSESFVGASAIGQVDLFNSHETGGRLKEKRLDELSRKGGVSDCGNSQNCVKVCPKEIPLTKSIAKMGRAVTVHKVKKFFSGK
jgi:succinate dehydrogenase / fumarate reductase, iron-sulfur subunit